MPKLLDSLYFLAMNPSAPSSINAIKAKKINIFRKYNSPYIEVSKNEFNAKDSITIDNIIRINVICEALVNLCIL
tara:strand:+ start:370 stop:594 length:225 start_codon:yes stop_codon:yes gene_type:complete